MNDKLISEPPLLVLPSLAKELGVTDAILLQQLFYAGQRTADGWVERSFPDWHRAVRGVFSARTIERAFAKLLERGWIEQDSRSGMAGRWRVTHDKLSGDPRQEVPTSCRGSVSREEKRDTDSPQKIPSSTEPPEFGEWIGAHVLEANRRNFSLSVPRAGTSYRKSLADTFAALQAEGYSLEDLKFASIGVLTDENMRGGGWIKPENVLRKTKIGGKIDRGRAQAETDTSAKYGHLDG